MKVTKGYIKQLVKEELRRVLKEGLEQEKKPCDLCYLELFIIPSESIATWRLNYEGNAGVLHDRGKFDNFQDAWKATIKGGNDPMPAAKVVFDAIQKTKNGKLFDIKSPEDLIKKIKINDEIKSY